MKKLLFFTLLAVVTMSANAQSKQASKKEARDYPHAEFGLKGGLNIADEHIQNTNNTDVRPSFNLGALAHIHFTEYFAVQPELVFSGQGFRQDLANGTNKYNLNYINMPVLAQFMFGDGFRLESGPQLGILAAAHQKAGKTSIDVKDNFKTTDFAWAFGLGYVTHSGFGVDARYNLGLSNINDLPGNKVYNRVFQTGIFYQFR